MKNLLRDRARADEAKEEKAPAARPTPAEAGEARGRDRRGAPARARARAAAARGDYARAVDDAYAALLRRLDGDGLIEIHPSRTNGDYVRAPRASGPISRARCDRVVRDVERVQFGATRPVGADLPRGAGPRRPARGPRARARARRLRPLRRALLHAARRRAADDEAAATRSPSGTQAVLEVLGNARASRRAAAPSRSRRSITRSRWCCCPARRSTTRRGSDLLGWVSDKGGTLVVAGRPRALPDEVGLRCAGRTSRRRPALTVAPASAGARPSRQLSAPARRSRLVAPTRATTPATYACAAPTPEGRARARDSSPSSARSAKGRVAGLRRRSRSSPTSPSRSPTTPRSC